MDRTVLTANSRLARVLALETRRQKEREGLRAWATPDILDYRSFLRRCWSDLLLSGQLRNPPVLLSSAQEQILWEGIIREASAGELLRVPETAASARSAWALLHEYRLDLRDARFAAHADWSAWFSWAERFVMLCKKNNWLTDSELSREIASAFASGKLSLPNPLQLAGFDEFTPAQTALLNAAGAWELLDPPTFDPTKVVVSQRDGAEELRAAAAWARQRFENNPNARIGVIVSNLATTRHIVERIFAETLTPGVTLPVAERPFHITAGIALSSYPIVAAALRGIAFANGSADLSGVGALLRSPFLTGAAKELWPRAQLDQKLRRNNVSRLTPPELAGKAGTCPILQKALNLAYPELPVQQLPSAWSETFSNILQVLRWPGDRQLNSEEYQTQDAFAGVFDQLASLDSIAGSISFTRAYETLESLAGETSFQPETNNPPIEILGTLEAAGRAFDHLWWLGLSDDALPARSRPHPFLPLGLQREHDLPHCSPERELSYAHHLFERIVSSAKDVVLSFPLRKGDEQLSPSPLLGRIGIAGDPIQPLAHTLGANETLERFEDWQAPPFPHSSVTGGASLLKDMALCHFRAFARWRLNASGIEDPEGGLRKMDQGKLVHKTLEEVWRTLGSHRALLAETDLEPVVSQAVALAVVGQSPAMQRIESRRITELILNWLDYEKQREPFETKLLEQKQQVTISGLTLTVRIDRVDASARGDVLIDYKTGVKINTSGWCGDRPDEPQIPLYAIQHAAPLAAVAFAHVKRGKPEMKKLSAQELQKELLPLPQQLGVWRKALENLVTLFVQGDARVNPKKNACLYCDFTSLCRIRDFGERKQDEQPGDAD